MSLAAPLAAGSSLTVIFGFDALWKATWPILLGLALIAAALAYATGIYAARALGTTVASFISLLEVLFAVAFAWMFVGEAPTLVQVVGGAFIVGGVVLVRLDESRHAESFGPVVAAMPFDAEAGVAAAANDSIYGLAAGIWTTDLSKAHKTARQLKAGSVWVNQYNGFDTAMPFGGFKQSGWGRELGAGALDLYTQTRSVNIQL